jgi:hypothetical protein
MHHLPFLTCRHVLVLVAAVLLLALSAADARGQVVDDDPVVSGPTSGYSVVTGAGWDDDLVRTTAEGEGGREVNAAEWSASVSPGSYRVEAWIPDRHTATFAKYFVRHVGGVKEVRLNQAGVAPNQWITLGVFSIDSAAAVRSTDASGYGGHELAWDAMRWTPVRSAPSPSVPRDAVHVIDDPSISGPAEYVTTFVGIGNDGDLLRTFAEGDGRPDVNRAEWLSFVAAGRYRVEAFVAREHGATRVKYDIAHRDGTTRVEIDQQKRSDAWADLGTYVFTGETPAAVRSGDGSGQRGEELSWDAVRLTRIDPAPAEPPASAPPSDPAPTDAASPGTQASSPPQSNSGPTRPVAAAAAAAPVQSPRPRGPRGALCLPPNRDRLDADEDGCADPVITEQDSNLLKMRVQTVGGQLVYRVQASQVDRPPGGRVHLTCVRCRYLTLPARADRPPKIRVLPRRVTVTMLTRPSRRLLRGSRINIAVTRPGWVGRLYRLRLVPDFTQQGGTRCLVGNPPRARSCPEP